MHYNKVFSIIPINLSFIFLMFVQQNVPALSFEVPARGYFMIHEIIIFAFTI